MYVVLVKLNVAVHDTTFVLIRSLFLFIFQSYTTFSQKSKSVPVLLFYNFYLSIFMSDQEIELYTCWCKTYILVQK